MNHSFRSTWAPRLLIAAVATAVALSAGSVLATTNAKGESAHLSLGIVGKDVVTSSGKARGVQVIEVFGPREGRSLKRGDVVTRVDGVRIRDGNDLEEALKYAGEVPSVEVTREGSPMEIQVPRLEDRLGWIGVLGSDDRDEIRRIVRDVQRDIHRDVYRDVHRIRVVDRTNIQKAVRRMVEKLRDLGLRFEDEGWI